jgi:hypothetical protein
MKTLYINLDGESPLMREPPALLKSEKMRVVVTMLKKNISNHLETVMKVCRGLKPLQEKIQTVTFRTTPKNASYVKPYLWFFPLSISIESP